MSSAAPTVTADIPTVEIRENDPLDLGFAIETRKYVVGDPKIHNYPAVSEQDYTYARLSEECGQSYVEWARVEDTERGGRVFILNSASARSQLVGSLQRDCAGNTFWLPARFHVGGPRMTDASQAAFESLSIEPISKLLNSHKTFRISTLTILREGVGGNMPINLSYALRGVLHYGDCFVGSRHKPDEAGPHGIGADVSYVNVEGMSPNLRLLIVIDSIASARSLNATFDLLKERGHLPHSVEDILFIMPYANREGLNLLHNHLYKVFSEQNGTAPSITIIGWGGLCGLGHMGYDEPLIHQDAILYGPDRYAHYATYGSGAYALCAGGDFGNNFFGPPLAQRMLLFQAALHRLDRTFRVLSSADTEKIFKDTEMVTPLSARLFSDGYPTIPGFHGMLTDRESFSRAVEAYREWASLQSRLSRTDRESDDF